MNKYIQCTVLIIALLLSACSPSTDEGNADDTIAQAQEIQNPTNKIQLSSEIDWEQLNPARGDQSPQAGTVWGDRKGEVPTGFLAKFVDGFSSPPHIHNVTYRAVVIKGEIHNDDPDAANMWMKPGSFWTQPAGESHITSARGAENIAYVEIDSGPYLVKPIEEATDNGERPVNIDASNIIWLNSSRTNWIDANSKAELSFLWESSNDLKGLFLKLPSGFQGALNSSGSIFHAVVIQGEVVYQMPREDAVSVLDAGSYFTSSDQAVHDVANSGSDDVVIYVRTNGALHVSS